MLPRDSSSLCGGGRGEMRQRGAVIKNTIGKRVRASSVVVVHLKGDGIHIYIYIQYMLCRYCMYAHIIVCRVAMFYLKGYHSRNMVVDNPRWGSGSHRSNNNYHAHSFRRA